MSHSFSTMANEAAGNGVGAMPALPSPLAQLQVEYARRLAEESPTFRPRGASHGSERDTGNGERCVEAKRSEYLFEGTIGKSSNDVITGLEASEAELAERAASLTDSSVFGFSDVKTSASQVSICLPSQCPSEYSSDDPMNIFAWNQRVSKMKRDSVHFTDSAYCLSEMNDVRQCAIPND